MKVTVDLSSLDLRTPAQEGVTENVSLRGARVSTNKPWKPNDRLNVGSLRGNFRSRARGSLLRAGGRRTIRDWAATVCGRGELEIAELSQMASEFSGSLRSVLACQLI
jgi:hypothetical protein